MRKTRKFPHMFGSPRRQKRIRKENWQKLAPVDCSICVSEPLCFYPNKC